MDSSNHPKYKVPYCNVDVWNALHEILRVFDENEHEKCPLNVTLTQSEWICYICAMHTYKIELLESHNYKHFNKLFDRANRLVFYLYKNNIYKPTTDDLLWLGDNNFTCVLNIAKDRGFTLSNEMHQRLDFKKSENYDILLDAMTHLNELRVSSSQKVHAQIVSSKAAFADVIVQLQESSSE